MGGENTAKVEKNTVPVNAMQCKKRFSENKIWGNIPKIGNKGVLYLR